MLTGDHTHISFLPPLVFPDSFLVRWPHPLACLYPRSVWRHFQPWAWPRDVAIRMNSLTHEGLYSQIPSVQMSEGRFAGQSSLMPTLCPMTGDLPPSQSTADLKRKTSELITCGYSEVERGRTPHKYCHILSGELSPSGQHG